MPAQQPPAAAAARPAKPGQWVTLQGLQARPDLNGADGRLLHFDEGAGRWAVRVLGSGEHVRVRPQHFRPARDAYESYEQRDAAKDAPRRHAGQKRGRLAQAAAAEDSAGEEEDDEEEEEDEAEVAADAAFAELEQLAADVDAPPAKRSKKAAAPAAAAAGAEEEDEEDEEDEEEEEDEEAEECIEDDANVRDLVIVKSTAADRIGTDFCAGDRLVLRAVDPGSPAAHAGAERCIGWRLTHVAGRPVSTLAEAAPLCAARRVEFRFAQVGERVAVPAPAGTAPPRVAFRIPLGAPLNPGVRIAFERTKAGELVYAVAGKRRDPIKAVHFAVHGDYFCFELFFLPLETRMWLPAGEALELLGRLRSLADACGVRHNIPQQLYAEQLDLAADMARQAAAEAEEAAKATARAAAAVSAAAAAKGHTTKSVRRRALRAAEEARRKGAPAAPAPSAPGAAAAPAPARGRAAARRKGPPAAAAAAAAPPPRQKRRARH
eukprot:TRINITY_DN33510_c0_g2_i1.p1 TRINITY_DN33510_c0_g2~~TRINITY_DN33510_c0_g2_i1.p1  ORF type:complete len:516 (+),score=180.43 TRINITY_DN33510_c0_g2_i1:75-1550(+)